MITAVSPFGKTGLSPAVAELDRPAAPVSPAASATSFSEALSGAATQAVATLDRAEALSLQALQGGGVETREVVDAVMSAEQSLQAAIAIRDKIVTAYLEISRMTI